MTRNGFRTWIVSLTLGSLSATASAELPSVKFMTAPLVSPTTTYYSDPAVVRNTNTHTVLVPGLTRAPEIKELAKGLGAAATRLGASSRYGDRVNQYIYANIRTSFMFGLQKGPLGALIDQAGTPFDQASLMVELLREGGVQAQYQLGTISLNALQASGWFGTTSAAAICQTLANGGIPATVNGPGSTCPTAGTVSSVTMLHVWVVASFPADGATRTYDPSFKVLAVKTGIDLPSAVLCGSNLGCTGSIGALGSTATSAATTGADTTVPTGATAALAGGSPATLEAQLGTWAMNLKGRLDAKYSAASLSDVIGAQEIDQSLMPLPAATLPYNPQASGNPWTEIWDQYRTEMNVDFDAIHYKGFADELWGQPLKLTFAADYTRNCDPNPCGPTLANIVYERTADLWAGWTKLATSDNPIAHGHDDILYLTADHPYAANSGTYMDETVTVDGGLVPVVPQLPLDTEVQQEFVDSYQATIVAGWGDTGQGAISRMSALQRKEPLGVDTVSFYINGATAVDPRWDHTLDACGWYYGNNQYSLGPNTISVMNPGCVHAERNMRVVQWLAESSRMADLVSQVNGTTILQHHSLGAIPWNDAIDIETAVSTISKNNTAADLRATDLSYAFLASRLEGGVDEQLEGIWEGGSPVSVMTRTNQKGIRLARFQDPAAFAAAPGYPIAGTDKIGLGNYVSQGYSVIVSESPPPIFTWPSQRYNPGGANGAQYNTHDYFFFGSALAIRPSSADPTVPDRIAFLTRCTCGNYGWFKGADNSIPGDNPVQATLKTTSLQDVSEKSRKYQSVDLNSGGFKLTPPADLSIGAGAFPFSLTFQRYYDSRNDTLPSAISVHEAHDYSTLDCSQPNVPTLCFHYTKLDYDPNGSAIGGGWDHNWHITASITSDAFQAMGEDSPVDAVGTITSLLTLRALTMNGPSFNDTLTAVYTSNWFGKGLVDNAVVVHRPPSSAVFVRLPDGSYNAPPSSPEILSLTAGGASGPFAKQPDFVTPVIPPALYDYRSIKFSLTDKQGTVLGFDIAQGDLHNGDTLGFKTFKPTLWTFPQGVSLTFAYDTTKQPYCLSSVTSNLLHILTFITEVPTITWPASVSSPAARNDYNQCYVQNVHDEHGRSVVFSRPSATDVLGQTNNGSYFGGLLRMPELDVQTDDSKTWRYLYTDNLSQSNIPRVGSVITSAYSPQITGSPFLTSTYDSLLRLSSTSDALGNPMNYFIGQVGYETLHLGESQDSTPLHAINTTYFDKFGDALQAVDALGRITSSSYDGRQRLILKTNPEINSTEYAYDARSNQTTVIQHPKSGTGDLTEITMFPPSCAGITAAACNRPATYQDVAGRVTTYGWNSAGQIASIQKPAVVAGTPVTRFCYANYQVGSLSLSLLNATVSAVDPTHNRVQRFDYETSSGQYLLHTSTTDPSNSFDSNCSQVTPASALNLTTGYTFDVMGNVHTIDGPLAGPNDVTTYTFDTMRRLVQIDGPPGTGIQTIYNYDGDGLLHSTQRQEIVAGTPVLRTETRSYYNTGDLQSVTDPNLFQTSYLYDPLGRQTLVTDADGVRTGTVYDAAGQVQCIFKGWGSSTAPSPSDCTNWAPSNYAGSGQFRYVAYQYTPNGKQQTIQDANNNQTVYAYDTQDRMATTTFPDVTTEKLTYTVDGTAAGQLCSSNGQPCQKITRLGQTIVSTYDALDEVLTKSPQGLPVVSYGHNLMDEPTSLLTAATGGFAGHSISYDYDTAGRKQGETTDSRRVSYTYDFAGNRATTTWPDNYYVSYQYDPASRLTTVWEGAVNTTKLADYTYDSLSRRTSLEFANSPANELVYGYDPDDSLISLVNNLNATTVAFNYGRYPSKRMKNFSANDAFYLPQPATVGSTGYTVNNLNEYTFIGGNKAYNDLNGNLTSWVASDGRQTYTYDSENRLRTAAVGGSVTPTITYDYDPLGRRISKTVGTAVTKFLDDGDEEIAEYDGTTGALQRRYVMGAKTDDRVARVEASGTKTYYHVDQQGSVVATTDSSGNAGQRMSYDEYGNLSPASTASSGVGEPYRYTGRRFDPETGLYYYRARYYAPGLGRFLQTDSVGYADDINLYAYVGNDPLDKTDPTGNCGPLTPLCVFLVEVLEVGGAAAEGGAAGVEVAEGAGALAEAGEATEAGVQGAEVEGQATQSLRTNMSTAGREVKAGEHGHHIVAQNARAAQPARDALARNGISVHNEANGARAGAQAHSGMHTSAYYRAVNQAVTNAAKSGRDAILSALRSLAKVIEGASKPPPPPPPLPPPPPS